MGAWHPGRGLTGHQTRTSQERSGGKSREHHQWRHSHDDEGQLPAEDEAHDQRGADREVVLHRDTQLGTCGRLHQTHFGRQQRRQLPNVVLAVVKEGHGLAKHCREGVDAKPTGQFLTNPTKQVRLQSTHARAHTHTRAHHRHHP